MASKKIQRIFSLLLLFFALPHLGFRFWPRNAEQEVPVPSQWVETHNQEAFRTYAAQFKLSPIENFVYSPLQDIRFRILSGGGLAFTQPGVFTENQEAVLNTLKQSLIENRRHAMKVHYQETLLMNSEALESKLIKTLAEDYRVKLKTVNTQKKSMGMEIRKWFQKKFNYEMSEASMGNSDLWVLSGISMSGKWSDGFLPEQTRAGTFEADEEKRSVVAMMFKEGYHGYFEEGMFQALDLRYGDGRVSLLVFLPNPGISLEEFYRQINMKTWNAWMDHFNEREGRIFLPRFKLSTPAMVCCQVTSYEVLEQGGKHEFPEETHALTSGDGLFEFNAKRPFFFALRDNRTGLLLLMGQVRDPRFLMTGVSVRDAQLELENSA